MIAADLLSFATDLAREAGQILNDGFRSPDLQISYKSRTNLVTDRDHAAERLIVSRILSAFGDDSIVAEEGSSRSGAGSHIWYVDPLDGTNNYAHGLPFFCVSIGIYGRESGDPLVGVVFNPFLDELFTAAAGAGAFLNGAPIRVSAMEDLGKSLLATGFPYNKEDRARNNLNEFNALLPRIQGIRRMGSAAIDLCSVACGRLDGYWEGELSPWDTAAGALIVREAGGHVTRYDGRPFSPDYPQVLASNGRIHTQMMEALMAARHIR